MIEDLKQHLTVIDSDPYRGDTHHTECLFASDDHDQGSVLAYHLGSLFADLRNASDLSSFDQWSRVARALRLHGLTIVPETITTLLTLQEAPMRLHLRITKR